MHHPSDGVCGREGACHAHGDCARATYGTAGGCCGAERRTMKPFDADTEARL